MSTIVGLGIGALCGALLIAFVFAAFFIAVLGVRDVPSGGGERNSGG